MSRLFTAASDRDYADDGTAGRWERPAITEPCVRCGDPVAVDRDWTPRAICDNCWSIEHEQRMGRRREYELATADPRR